MNLFAEAKKVLDKDGKVNALGPYGKQKLTGKEVSQYFRKNKVSDPQVKKAVEVALDLGGADSVARQEIKKFYGDKILKSKEVQNALRHANEETNIQENIQKVVKMFPRDMSWKKLVMKHRRAIDDFRKNKKDLPAKVEDDLLMWGFDSGEISNEDDAERFIDDILNEKFKPYIMKGYERVTDFYVQFRGGRGDRITSPENKKDFETAKKLITAYGKKHKLNIKDSSRQKIYGTPQEGSSAYKISLYAKHHTNDPNHDLAPLLAQIAKLKTAEDHGGGNAKPIKEETVNEIFGISQDPRYRAKVMKMLDDEGIKYKKDGRNALIILGVAPKDQKKLLDRIHKEFGMTSYNIIDEGTLSEGKNLVPAVKKIVDTKGAAKVGGVMIDMFTASMISQIYDKVNDQNKKRMENSNIQTLVGLAQKMMQKNSVNEETLAEGYSKKMSDREIEAVAKKYNMGQDEKDDYKKQYSPAKIGKGSSWLAISYPVKDGEYYFAFISKDEKKNVKYNDLLNKELKKLYKKHLNSSGKRGSTNLADAIWDDLPEVMKGFPRDLGWNDTMTREEIWGAITNMSGLREDVEESNKVLIGKMRLGKRKKAPKFEAANPAQQAAIAIAKKKKNESVMDTYRQMWEDAQNITEVSDKEINAMKKVSKDMQKVLVSYQKIANMGDKELKNTKHNYDYEQVLKARDTIISMIGKLQTRQTIEKSMRKEGLDEKLNKQDLKFIDMMYDKKGNLTDVGKAVMNYKPGDNIRKIVQNLNNKKK